MNKKITWISLLFLLITSVTVYANFDEKPLITPKGGTGSAVQSPNVVVTTDGSSDIVSTSSTTATEIGYVHGVTSSIQTQFAATVNKFLSNLTAPTALNASLLPASAGSANLGSSTLPFGTDFAQFVELMGSTSGDIIMQAAAVTTPYTITWPSAVAVSANQVLTSDTAGNLSWTTQTTGANQALSNLMSVAINTSLLPGSTTIDLGSAAFPFESLYLVPTTSSTIGVIEQNGGSLVSTFGDPTNLFLGFNAGNFTLTPSSNSNNVAIGAGSLPVITTANNELALGPQTLTADVSGSDNISSGENSFNSLVSGTSNVGVGSFTGVNIVAGTQNSFFGHGAGSGFSNDHSGTTSIGLFAIADEDNATVIGAIAGLGNASVSSPVGIGTDQPQITASLTLDVGASDVGNIAPLNIQPGTLITAPVSGAIENNGVSLFYTTATPARFALLTTQTGADIHLDNLSAVAINTSLLPATSGSANIGSAVKPFGTDFEMFLELIGSTSGDIILSPGTTPTAHTVVLPPTVCTSGQYWSDNGSGVYACTSPMNTPITVVDGGDAAYAIQPTDGHIRDTTPITANRVYTLDACTSGNIGEKHEIKNVPYVGNVFTITVAPNGTDQIDQLASNPDAVLSSGDSLPLICAVAGQWDIE